MDTIRQKYEKLVPPTESRLRKDDIYSREKNRANQLYAGLCESLADRDAIRLKRMVRSEKKATERKCMHFFLSGFKAGLLISKGWSEFDL